MTRSELRKREWQNPEIRAKRLKRRGMLGKKHSLETRKRWSEKRKGIHYNPATEFRVGHKKPDGAYSFEKGKKNPAWKGGLCGSLRHRIMSQLKYKKWREGVFERDNYTCQFCQKRGGTLNADHIEKFSKILARYIIETVEEALKCDELWYLKNGRTLCKHCHKIITFKK